MGKKVQFVFYRPYTTDPNHKDFEYDSVISDFNKAKPGVQIKSVKEMVARVLYELAQTGAKIGGMVFGGHAGPGYFYIGEDRITGHGIGEFAQDLVKLAPFFAPNAHIVIYSCKTARNVMPMYFLSHLWPGVDVSGWTGDVVPTDSPWGPGIEGEGTRVLCHMSGCQEI